MENLNIDNFSEPQFKSQIPQIKQEKNIYKPLFFIFFVLFLISSSSFITFMVNQNNISKQRMLLSNSESIEKKSDEIKTDQNIPTGTEQNLEWRTQNLSNNKFSISYPADWILSQAPQDPNSISLNSPKETESTEENYMTVSGINMTIYNSFSELPEYEGKIISKDTKTLEEYVKGELFDVEKININGATAFSGYSGYPDHRIYIQKGNTIINIVENSIDSSMYKDSLEERIINTIKINN